MEAGRPLILLLLAVGLCRAQGTESKKSASEFPVHAALSDADAAADFMVRLISYGRESFVTDNFLVVEVAIFPHAGKVYDVRANQFSLRVNGKKEALFAQTTGHGDRVGQVSGLGDADRAASERSVLVEAESASGSQHLWRGFPETRGHGGFPDLEPDRTTPRHRR